MYLGKNNPKYNYPINNNLLHESTSEKDLGVHVDPLLNFEEHINITVKKAKKIADLIIRNRPILKYGNVIWSLQIKTLILLSFF